MTTPLEAKEIEGLTAGRMVHYVMGEGPHAGDHRPAIVVKVWSKTSGTSNLQLFVDGQNDGYPAGQNVVWKTSVVYSAEPKPNTWHFIERA